MKKLTLSLILAILAGFAVNAQENIFTKGQQVVNAGIGFGSVLYSGTYYKNTVPPLSVSYEKGIKDGVIDKGVIGVGGYLAYASYKWEYSSLWYYKYSDFIIGARGTFHYPLVDKLDTYTGLILGYDIASSKETGTAVTGYNYNASSGGVRLAWFAGARYYFNDKFGAMAEIGYGITYFNLGVAIKL